MELEFSQHFFSKNSQTSNFTKIRPLGSEFISHGRRDGRTWCS